MDVLEDRHLLDDVVQIGLHVLEDQIDVSEGFSCPAALATLLMENNPTGNKCPLPQMNPLVVFRPDDVIQFDNVRVAAELLQEHHLPERPLGICRISKRVEDLMSQCF